MGNTHRTFLLAAFLSLAVCAQAQQSKPFTKQELLNAIKEVKENGKDRTLLTEEVQKRGVSFKVTNVIMKELTAAGAWPSLNANAILYYKGNGAPKKQ